MKFWHMNSLTDFSFQVPFQKVCRQNDTCIAELDVNFNFTYVHLYSLDMIRGNGGSSLFFLSRSELQRCWWPRKVTSTSPLGCPIMVTTRTTPTSQCTIPRACRSLRWLSNRWLKIHLLPPLTPTSLESSANKTFKPTLLSLSHLHSSRCRFDTCVDLK